MSALLSLVLLFTSVSARNDVSLRNPCMDCSRIYMYVRKHVHMSTLYAFIHACKQSSLQSLAVNIHCEFSSRFHSDSKRIRSGFESKRREFTTFSRNSMASRILVAFSQ